MSHDSDIRGSYIGLLPHQHELIRLAELAGVQADPAIFRVLIELLSMQIEPNAIYKLLRYIRKTSRVGKPYADRKHTSASLS